MKQFRRKAHQHDERITFFLSHKIKMKYFYIYAVIILRTGKPVSLIDDAVDQQCDIFSFEFLLDDVK